MIRPGSWPSILLTLLFAVLIAACHGKTILLVADLAKHFDVPQAQASWVVSAVAIIAALASPFITQGIRHIGERRAIAAGLLVAAGFSFAASIITSFSALLIVRVLEGAGYIVVVLAALALLLRTTEGKKRTSALALWSVASPLGGAIAIFSVAPYVGGNWREVFVGHSIVLLVLIALTPLLPDKSGAKHGPTRSVKEVLASYLDSNMLRLALAVAAPLTVSLGLVAIVPSYLINTLGVAPQLIGVISTVSILSSVAAGFFAGYILNHKVGPYAVVVAAIVGVSLEILVFVPGIAAQTAIIAKMVQGFFTSFVVAWVFTSIPRMSTKTGVVGAGGIAEQALYVSMFLGPVLLFPLYALESRAPFFIAMALAGLAPLVLLPLGFNKVQAQLASASQ